MVQTKSKWARGSAASASPGSLSQLQHLRPHPDLRKENLHFNKIPRWFICTLELGSTVVLNNLFVLLFLLLRKPSQTLVCIRTTWDAYYEARLPGPYRKSNAVDLGRGSGMCIFISTLLSLIKSLPHQHTLRDTLPDCDILQIREGTKGQRSCWLVGS